MEREGGKVGGRRESEEREKGEMEEGGGEDREVSEACHRINTASPYFLGGFWRGWDVGVGGGEAETHVHTMW